MNLLRCYTFFSINFLEKIIGFIKSFKNSAKKRNNVTDLLKGGIVNGFLSN
jgi:hypothetical protein